MIKKKNLLGLSTAATLLLCGSLYASNNVLINSKSNIIIPQHVVKGSTKSAAKKLAQYVEGEVIVKYKAKVAASRVSTLASAKGLSVTKRFSALSSQSKGTYAKVTGKYSTAELVKMLKADPNVESVQPNYIRHLSATPNDPAFNQVWGMNNTGQSVNGTSGTPDADIDAVEAWDISTGDSSVVVAVFDTGVDYTHEDLVDNMWHNPGETAGDGIDNDNNGYIDDVYGADVAASLDGTQVDGDPMDTMGHGTHCAGTIGAVGDNGTGVTGVNWNVSIMAMKVFRPDGGAYDEDILDAIDYVLDQKSKGVNIVSINASYGGAGGDQSDPMNAAIKSLGTAGIVFCAAAGNGGSDGIGDDNDAVFNAPSNYDAPNLIAVAATDQDDQLASFSNYGVTTVDLAAPGVNIRSTLPAAVEYTPDPADTYYEDFDPSPTGWTYGGTWGVTNSTAISGQSLTDSPNGNYADNSDTYADSPIIDLSGLSGNNVVLAFSTKFDLEEGYDFAYVWFSKDSGATWSTSQITLTGSSGWTTYNLSIPSDYLTSGFMYSIGVVTDSSTVDDGLYVDNIGIGTGTLVGGQYGYKDGTSMATPAVTGAVALLAAAHPGETAAQRKDRLLNSVDIKSSLQGKMLTNGRMNLAAAIAGATPPSPAATIILTDDAVTTNYNTDVVIDTMANDTLPAKILQLNWTDPLHGTIIFDDRFFTYSPDSDYSGIDTFSYTLTDPDTDEHDTATVRITVNATTSGGSGDSDDGGSLPVNDTYSLLLTIFGLLGIGGLIARRKLA